MTEGQQPDLQNLVPVPSSIAIRTAQVHVTQELHLDALESVSSARGTAPLSGIEAERPGGVATLNRQWFCRKELANPIEGADVAGGIRTCGFSDRGLVYQDDIVDCVVALNPAMNPRGLSRAVLQLTKGVVEHILHQSRLPRSADTGNTDELPQWNLDIDVLEVVLGRPQDLEAALRAIGAHSGGVISKGATPGGATSGGATVGPLFGGSAALPVVIAHNALLTTQILSR